MCELFLVPTNHFVGSKNRPYLVPFYDVRVPGYPEFRYPKYPEPGNKKVRVIGRSTSK